VQELEAAAVEPWRQLHTAGWPPDLLPALLLTRPSPFPKTNAQVNKQTSELVFDQLHATAFQFSPLGRTILGPEANIRSITRQNLVDYMAAHYK
jgi:hypothetical protein